MLSPQNPEAEVERVNALESLLNTLSAAKSPSGVMGIVSQIFALKLSDQEMADLPRILWMKAEQIQFETQNGQRLQFGSFSFSVSTPEANKLVIRFIETILRIRFPNTAFRFLVAEILRDGKGGSSVQEKDAAILHLLTLLSQVEDLTVQRAILSFLSDHPTLDSVAAFKLFLNSDDPQIRISCIRGLAATLHLEAELLLITMLEGETDPNVTREIDRVFGALQGT